MKEIFAFKEPNPLENVPRFLLQAVRRYGSEIDFQFAIHLNYVKAKKFYAQNNFI